jgi:hypothetical protein
MTAWLTELARGEAVPDGLTEWAAAEATFADEADYFFADLLNAFIAAAVLLIPVVVLTYHFWSAINPWRRLVYSDLISIPAAAAFVLLSFIALRRYRRGNTAHRLRAMTWERARAAAFARIATDEEPHASATTAGVLREHSADFIDP